MWIEKLKSGRYRAVERYTEIMTGKQKKVSVTMDKNTAASRKAAEAALIEKIRKLSGSAPEHHELTLSELVDLWREYQVKSVKQSTYKRNYHAMNTILQILGADTLVSRLSARYISNQMAAKNEKPGTTNERIKRLKSMLRWAYKNDYVSDISYIDKLDALKNDEKKEKLAVKYLEAEELKSLLNHMQVERWHDLTIFLSLSGLRVGEAFALNYQDIDLKERQIHVHKTYDVSNDIMTSTKTSSSTRDVYIQDELLSLCKKLRSAAATKKLVGGNGYIFHESRYDYHAYEKYFGENTEHVLCHRLTPHALRHTHVALLAEQGIPLDAISRRLGHKDSKITANVYFHVTKKLKEKEDLMIRDIKIL